MPFDLEAALKAWRREVSAQPHLSAEIQGELETHLLDTLAELRRRGLNDEEAFLIARRRVGRPLALESEFERADPDCARRSQLAVIGSAVLAIWIWRQFTDALLFSILVPLDVNYSTLDRVRFWVRQIALEFIFWGPVVWLALSAARGRNPGIWSRIISSRARFLACAGFLLVMSQGVDLLMLERRISQSDFLAGLINLGPVVLLVTAVALILPRGKQRLRPPQPA